MDVRTPNAMSTEELHGHIVDYACRHRLMDVICDVSKRYKKKLSSLPHVPHVRLACAALYKMVENDCVQDFPTAIQLCKQLFDTQVSWSNHLLVRCYAKLMCGLKVKVLFYSFEATPEKTSYLFRKYFPREGDEMEKSLDENAPTLAEEIQKAVREFQKSFLPLVLDHRKRQAFMANHFERLYGKHFTICLARRTAAFLAEIEKDLPKTLIDELFVREAEGKLKHTPAPDLLTEVLMNCVEGRRFLQSSDLLNLLHDLSPHSTPNMEGFCSSFIVSGSGSTLCPSTGGNDELPASSGSELSSSTDYSEVLCGPTPAHQGHGILKRTHQGNVELDFNKRRKNGRSVSTEKGGETMLRPCHVVLSHQRNLSTCLHSGVQIKVFW